MITVEHLSFHYGKHGPDVLKDICFSLQDGEIGVLLGKNGSGKTTLFKNILGLEHATAGKILFNGEDLLSMNHQERAKRIAYVPQHIHFGALSVYDSILMGRLSYFGSRAGKEDYEAVDEIIENMGLSQFATRNAEALSGGEKQKIAIARALAQNPQMLVFDEPTGNLDIANEGLIVQEAKKVAKEKNIAILASLHDINQALELGQRFFFMKEGSLCHEGGKESINTEVLQDVFGVTIRMANVEGRTIAIREYGE